jgi:hypothetical protein
MDRQIYHLKNKYDASALHKDLVTVCLIIISFP